VFANSISGERDSQISNLYVLSCAYEALVTRIPQPSCQQNHLCREFPTKFFASTWVCRHALAQHVFRSPARPPATEPPRNGLCGRAAKRKTLYIVMYVIRARRPWHNRWVPSELSPGIRNDNPFIWLLLLIYGDGLVYRLVWRRSRFSSARRAGGQARAAARSAAMRSTSPWLRGVPGR
jgi:hypothetical protein